MSVSANKSSGRYFYLRLFLFFFFDLAGAVLGLGCVRKPSTCFMSFAREASPATVSKGKPSTTVR